jgi:transposase-like protein
VAIDHCSKWCEVKVVVDHDAVTTTRLFEDEMICRFGVPKYIIIDNESKWLAKFDQLCKNYSIIH